MADKYVSVMDPAYQPPDMNALRNKGLLRGLLDASPLSAFDAPMQAMQGSQVPLLRALGMLYGAGQQKTPTDAAAGLFGIAAPQYDQFQQGGREANALYGMGRAIGVAAPAAGGLLARNMPRPAQGELNALVYHGSPHKFDKFDGSKIGTGEGAQAYGHGIYVAESPSVAGSYTAANAAGGRAIAELDGVPVSSIKNKTGVADWLDSYGSIANTRAALKGRHPELLKELDALVQSGRLTEGNLYKADLADAAIPKMLDWDKPLKDQPENVKKAFNLDKHAPDAPIHNMTGMEAYVRYGKRFNNPTSSAPETAAAFRELGIPGIRYLDGGSRTGGAGTSNFVVFPGNEGLLKILERNGQPLK